MKIKVERSDCVGSISIHRSITLCREIEKTVEHTAECLMNALDRAVQASEDRNASNEDDNPTVFDQRDSGVRLKT